MCNGSIMMPTCGTSANLTARFSPTHEVEGVKSYTAMVLSVRIAKAEPRPPRVGNGQTSKTAAPMGRRCTREPVDESQMKAELDSSSPAQIKGGGEEEEGERRGISADLEIFTCNAPPSIT